MRIKGIVFALIGFLCIPAFAAESAPYVGLGGGMYNVKVDTGSGFSDFDDSAGLFRVYAGYQFNDYVSLQADYLLFGDAEDNFSGTKIELSNGDAWEVSVRPSYPINEKFDVFARLGWEWYQFDLKAQGFGSASGDDDDFVWGLGGTWQFDKSWGVRGEYAAVNISGGDLDMWTLSVVYKFLR
jgi:hypothetical protein